MTTDSPPGRHRASVVLAAIVLAVLAVACAPSPGGPVGTEPPTDPVAVLAARPPITAALAYYEEMQKRIRDAIDAEIGPRPWRVFTEGDEQNCYPPLNRIGGVVRGLRRWGFSGPIPDDKWPQVQQAIARVTAEYGFDAPGMQINRPGYHKTTGVDTKLGAYYEFGDGGNTVMQVTTGCHLED